MKRAKRLNNKQIGVIYVRGVAQDTKREFKALCARKGKTMAEVLEALMCVLTRQPNLYKKLGVEKTVTQLESSRS